MMLMLVKLTIKSKNNLFFRTSAYMIQQKSDPSETNRFSLLFSKFYSTNQTTVTLSCNSISCGAKLRFAPSDAISPFANMRMSL